MSDAADTVTVVVTLITLTVVGLVGREVVAAQLAAFEQCASDCELLGYAAAGVDAVLATPGAIAGVWIGPLPLGWAVLAVGCLFLLDQFVVAPYP